MDTENIHAMIDTWLKFSLENPIYVAVIAVSVFLFTALLYSFRISGLNKKLTLRNQARQEAEKQLNNAKQELQNSQEQLANNTAQVTDLQNSLQTEKQRALDFAQHISERNQQITAIVQRLASSFDISERPVVTVDFKAEDLWQQHDRVIEQLIENLQAAQKTKTELQASVQAEKNKVAEIEARLTGLQMQLDSQISLVTTLQQQQSQNQQALVDATQKQQADAMRVLQLEQQIADYIRQLDNIKNTLPIVNTVPLVTEPSPAPAPVVDDSTEKLKNLFKKPALKPIQPAPIVQQEVVEKITPIVQNTVEETMVMPTVEEQPVVIEETETYQAAETEVSDSLLTGWYKKLASKKTVAAEEETIIEPEPESIVEAESVVQEKSEKPSVVKGWYQKFSNKTEPEVVSESESATLIQEESEKTSIVKGLYQKITNKTESEIVSEPTKTEPVVKPDVKNSGLAELNTKFVRKTTKVIEEDNDDDVEGLAEKLADKIEKFSKWFSKKDED